MEYVDEEGYRSKLEYKHRSPCPQCGGALEWDKTPEEICDACEVTWLLKRPEKG